jgi:glutaconyl-CoA/methylmalonyl-CoA decarboxylase subunit gamma
MRLIVDGRASVLEVDLAKGEVRVGGVLVPFKVLEDAGAKIELSLDGEKYFLEGWVPGGELLGPHDVVVNRETCRIEVAELGAEGPAARAPSGPPPTGPSVPARPSSPAAGAGVAITTPMPGKVLEVRVQEGEAVKAGTALLVLEAMKMRNELQSPADGKVQGLSVAPGDSVKAKQVLLRVVPP